MKYFITGATGFVGGRVAKLLREKNHEVVAVVRNPEKAGELRSIDVRIIKGDVTDKESLRESMKGCDGVFHIAGWFKYGRQNQKKCEVINVDGTRNVLELMKELKIPKGVYTSTCAINSDTHGQLRDESYHFTGKHISVYDRTKAEAHEIAERFIKEGLPLVIVMPGLIYGPDGTSMSDDSLRQYLRKKLPMIPREAAYSWTYVDDVVMGHWLAMEKGKPGEKYIICGPPHTLIEAYTLANKMTGIRKPLFVPPWLLTLSAPLVSVVERIFPLPEVYSSESLRTIAGVTYLGDNSKAKRELGFNPRPLEEGLQETLPYEMIALGIKPN